MIIVVVVIVVVSTPVTAVISVISAVIPPVDATPQAAAVSGVVVGLGRIDAAVDVGRDLDPAVLFLRVVVDRAFGGVAADRAA